MVNVLQLQIVQQQQYVIRSTMVIMRQLTQHVDVVPMVPVFLVLVVDVNHVQHKHLVVISGAQMAVFVIYVQPTGSPME